MAAKRTGKHSLHVCFSIAKLTEIVDQRTAVETQARRADNVCEQSVCNHLHSKRCFAAPPTCAASP
jgi:hypothetical protein